MAFRMLSGYKHDKYVCFNTRIEYYKTWNLTTDYQRLIESTCTSYLGVDTTIHDDAKQPRLDVFLRLDASADARWQSISCNGAQLCRWETTEHAETDGETDDSSSDDDDGTTFAKEDAKGDRGRTY